MPPGFFARRRLPVLLVACLGLATGCVTAPPGDDAGQWRRHRAELLTLDRWSADGRVALRTADRGWSGNLSWSQEASDMDVRFRGPLGAGAFRLAGNSRGLRLHTADGEVLYFAEPQRELADEIGWYVPLDSMRYWVLGVADPEAPARETLDEQGRLAGLDQLGWQVSYESYRSDGVRMLPRKLVIESADVRIRFIVDRWSIGT